MQDSKDLMFLKGKRKRNESMSFVPHKDIEKRRRERVNGYISDLSSIMSSTDTEHKVDKLTVLRLAIEYMRNLAGGSPEKSITTLSKDIPPSYSCHTDILPLALEAALSEKFLVVIGCDARLRILHMTQNARKKLQIEPCTVLGTSFLDLLHPFDVAEVKRQIYASEAVCKKKNSLDCSAGSRRAFYCRIKVGMDSKKRRINKDENKQTIEGKHYALVHMSGYFKPWKPESDEDAEAAADLGCFVAIAAVFKTFAEEEELERVQKFDTKHAADGKFLSSCQSTTYLTGHLPQDLVDRSSYSFFHQEDLEDLSVSHYQLLANDYVQTNTYRFMCSQADKYITVVTVGRLFRNPFNHEPEMLLCSNILVQCGILMQLHPNPRNKARSTCQREKKNKTDQVLSTVQETPFCELKEKVESYLFKPAISVERVKSRCQVSEDETIGSLVMNHYKERSQNVSLELDNLQNAAESDHPLSNSNFPDQGTSPCPGVALMPLHMTGEIALDPEQVAVDIVGGDKNILLDDSVEDGFCYELSSDSTPSDISESETLNDFQIQEIQQLIENQKYVQEHVLKILEARGKVLDDDEIPGGYGMQMNQIKQPQLQIYPVDELKKSLEISAFSSDVSGVPVNRFGSQVQFATPIIPGLAPLHKDLLSSRPQSSFDNISEEELQYLRDGALLCESARVSEPVVNERPPAKEMNASGDTTLLLDQENNLSGSMDLSGVLSDDGLIPGDLLSGGGSLHSTGHRQVSQDYLCDALNGVPRLQRVEEISSLLQQENSSIDVLATVNTKTFDTEKIEDFEGVSEDGSECFASPFLSNTAMMKGPPELIGSCSNNLLSDDECTASLSSEPSSVQVTIDDITLPSGVLHTCDITQAQSFQNIFDFLITDQ